MNLFSKYYGQNQMLCNFKDCNIEAAAATYLFFLCNFKGHFHLYLKLPRCTKNVCNPKANPIYAARYIEYTSGKRRGKERMKDRKKERKRKKVSRPSFLSCILNCYGCICSYLYAISQSIPKSVRSMRTNGLTCAWLRIQHLYQHLFNQR